jgi:sterol desaturase/sphingolipid hydroxylase (fatty acid hydroxylase superfamily)
MEFEFGFVTPLWLQLAIAVSIVGSLHFASMRRSNSLCAAIAIISLIVPILTGLRGIKSLSVIQWAVVVYNFMALALLGWEHFSPRTKYQWSSRQLFKSVTYVNLWFLLIPLFYVYILYPTRDLVPKLWAMDQRHVPIWVQLIVLILATNLLQYLLHRSFHYFEFAWRFHKVHHALEQVNVMAKFQDSPYEYFFGALVGNISVILLLNPSPPTVFFYVIHVFIKGPFAHANVDFPRLDRKLPWWAYIVATPNIHAHHHTLAGMRSNYGTGLMIWDWVFGTFEIPSETPRVFGIGSKRFSEQGILADQIAPFLSQARYEESAGQPGAEVGAPIANKRRNSASYGN